MSAPWPVLRVFDAGHLDQVALPVGGIGTGTVSIGGRGDLRDWEVANRPAKGFAPAHSFFAIHVRRADGTTITRALEGRPSPPYDGWGGASLPNAGLPRFASCEFRAAYPLGQVVLSDPHVPVGVRIEAFNPFIPADAESSGIPVAVLRFVVSNDDNTPARISICGSVQNFIGRDLASGNTNELRSGRRVRGIMLRPGTLDPNHEDWGTLALTTTARSVTTRTAWTETPWTGPLLDFWDDFASDGRLDDRPASASDRPMASLATSVTVPPRGQRSLTYLLAWHFPNRPTWSPGRPDVLGNFYASRFSDAWDVAEHTATHLSTLERGTVAFVDALTNSDLPVAVKDAALSTLVTLRSQVSFRASDGRFYGFEGCSDTAGCCLGSCTHVWNYEQATPFLFADLARGMREVELAHATRANGRMSFRAHLPLAHATEWPTTAADGQMGCIMKLYREWQLSGDDEFLRSLWPFARRALEFAWIPGGWDADRDGVMEGCQHNTMDVDYYGPNPQMGVWYLGALRAAEEMSAHLGDTEFASECRRLFDGGSAWIDANLFNGEYYEHQIRPTEPSHVADGLQHTPWEPIDARDPAYQLGPGCLVDQLVGQYMAHVCGLGHLLSPTHVRTTMRSIRRHNHRRGFDGHFNPARSFALGDESGLLMATWPRGGRPARPFPYFAEVMTGFEYTAGAGMLFEGLTQEGIGVFADVRARFDGRRRNPFDEAECGHHYARAMAAWSGVLALTGFGYSAVQRSMRFAASDVPARWFWSTGRAWGTFAQRPTKRHTSCELRVLRGSVRLKTFALTGRGEATFARAVTVSPSRPLDVRIKL